MANALRGRRVVIAGGGLAGLTAARDLTAQGARVTVFEARARLGGRVWTTRDAPIAPFYGELGAELVDADHKALIALCRAFRLPLKRILLRGFGLAVQREGRIRVFHSQSRLWKRLSAVLQSRADALERVNGEWTSSIAASIGAESVHSVLQNAGADEDTHDHALGFRNFWMADPDQVSALVTAAQVLDGDPSQTAMYHVVGGTDQVVHALAAGGRARIRPKHVVRRIESSGRRVRVNVEGGDGRRAEVEADYVVIAVPPPLLRDIVITPALPDAQQTAYDTLATGPGTKAVLRFPAPWWRRAGRPRAYGSTLPIGAVWDSGEAQQDAAILSLLAGARASAQLQRVIEREGPQGLVDRLGWFGGGTTALPQVHAVSWERDPWARGAYAYFSPRFDPALRPLLSRAAGRIFFAGCHTSREYQGYMNGAVESGHRVAEEILQHARL